MSFLGNVIRNLIRRKPQRTELESIEDVLDAAHEYASNQLPWWEAAKVGPIELADWRTGELIESTAYARFLAVVYTPTSDPRRRSTLKLVDELVAQSGTVITTQGVFERNDLAGVTVRTYERKAA